MGYHVSALLSLLFSRRHWFGIELPEMLMTATES